MRRAHGHGGGHVSQPSRKHRARGKRRATTRALGLRRALTASAEDVKGVAAGRAAAAARTTGGGAATGRCGHVRWRAYRRPTVAEE